MAERLKSDAMDESKQQPVKNRRIFARRASKRKSKIHCYKGALDLGANLALTLLDISESGVRLLIKSALDPGQEVTLGFEGITHQRPVKANGTIIWCVAAQDGSFCVGVKLDKYLPYQEISRLI
jgi:hypothetical protein